MLLSNKLILTLFCSFNVAGGYLTPRTGYLAKMSTAITWRQHVHVMFILVWKLDLFGVLKYEFGLFAKSNRSCTEIDFKNQKSIVNRTILATPVVSVSLSAAEPCGLWVASVFIFVFNGLFSWNWVLVPSERSCHLAVTSKVCWSSVFPTICLILLVLYISIWYYYYYY